MLRRAGNSAGGDGAAAIEHGAEFVFPATGPLKPPEPPRPYTAAQLDSTYTQASQLWPQISRESCANALSSKFADGDPRQAIVLIQFYLDAAAGYVTSVCKRNGSFLTLRGADNYGAISCYADSLLVAMFSRMDNFEPLLYKKRYEDSATDQFATWLRLFVNLLRNGERITDDIVEAMLATAVAAGWTAGSTPLSQQDAAEFFVFITEKLKMPLLALRVDIAHAGREVEEYDHKLIREQLLYLPVPGTEQDPPILFEECLEVYFSNAINVSRHVAQPSLSGSLYSAPPGCVSPGPSLLTRSGTNKSSDVFSQGSRHRSYSIMSVTSPSLRRPGRQSLDDGSLSGALNSQQNASLMPSLPVASHSSASASASASASPMPQTGLSPPFGGASGSGGIGGSSSGGGGGGGSSSVSFSSPSQQPSSLCASPSPLRATQSPRTPPLSSTEGGAFDPLDESEPAVLPRTPEEPASTHPQDQLTPPPQVGSLPSYYQLFGVNEDKQADARVRDMKRSLWTSNNEIMLPAWMFLQLMPFYADISSNRDSNLENLEADEVANHFRQTRPVLGFCLKRYYFDEQGCAQRNNRTVIIPEEINMPSFVADDSDQKQAFGSFKLVLESAIFHRGTSIHSGHYLALVSEDQSRHRKPSLNSEPSRMSWMPKQSLDVPPSDHRESYLQTSPTSVKHTAGGSPQSHPFTPSPQSSERRAHPHFHTTPRKRWYLFDDMRTGGERVKEVDYNSVFDRETPYMLFYRMVSLEDEGYPLQTRGFYSPFGQSSSNLTSPSAVSPSILTQPSSFIPSESPSRNQSNNTSRATSPEPGKEKDKKKKSKFFRRNKDKERDKQKDYASKYREEKCRVM